MTDIVATNVTGTEVVRLLQEGHTLLCPRCGSIIKSVPENWNVGMPLYGIECPVDQKHFMIHFEDEQAMKEIRSRMKARAAKK